MRKLIALVAGGATLSLFACLVAPDEPSSESALLVCSEAQRPFNGACRKTCNATADCGGSDSCMKVSASLALCLAYQHCAYLGSDTECAGYAGYGSYGTAYGTAYSDGPWNYTDYGYGYGYGSGCVGNATWNQLPPAGDPRCGGEHPVNRCQRVGTSCAIVSGATVDTADP